MDPDNVLILGNRCACYLALKKYDLAIKDAEKSINLDKSFIKGYYRLSKALIGIGNHERATQTTKLGLSIDPMNKDLNNLLTECQKLSKENKKQENNSLKKRFKNALTDEGANGCFYKDKNCICSQDNNFIQKEIYCAPVGSVIPASKTKKKSNNSNQDINNTLSYIPLSTIGMEMKKLIKNIREGNIQSSERSNVIPTGYFNSLLEEKSFRDILYPGTTDDVRRTLPKNLTQLLNWDVVYRDLIASLPRLAAKGDTSFQNVLIKGERAGQPPMDELTRQVVSAEFAKEIVAQEIVSIVHNLATKVNNVVARTTLSLATRKSNGSSSKVRVTEAASSDSSVPETVEISSDDSASDFEDILDESALSSLLGSAGSCVVDGSIGEEWTALILADVRRYQSTEDMIALDRLGRRYATAANATAANATAAVDGQGGCRMAWLEPEALGDRYPALGELVQWLHRIPAEINGGYATNRQHTDTISDFNTVRFL